MASTTYSQYKKIRNQLAKYRPESIIYSLAPHLWKFDVEHIRHYVPWDLLLLIRLSLEHYSDTTHTLPSIPNDKLKNTINMMHELGETLRLPSDYDNIRLYIKTIAHQQFYLQGEVSVPNLCRQELIFGSKSSWFHTEFLRVTGIDFQAFMNVWLAFYCSIARERRFFMKPTDVHRFIKYFSKDGIQFLRLISANAKGLKENIASYMALIALWTDSSKTQGATIEFCSRARSYG